MDSRASSLPTCLMFLIMGPFFKHYTPQLAHNCCPCLMNNALCNANPGSLALDKSQAVEEAGVITQTIPGTLGEMSILCLSFHPAFPCSLGSPHPSQLHRAWSLCQVPSEVHAYITPYHFNSSPAQEADPCFWTAHAWLETPVPAGACGSRGRGFGEVHVVV